MAKRRRRYAEARMYLAGASVGLLLIVWSVLAMKDRAGSATTSAQTLVDQIPTAAPAATPQPAAASTPSSGGKPAATASRRPTQQPQTRSRGS